MDKWIGYTAAVIVIIIITIHNLIWKAEVLATKVFPAGTTIDEFLEREGLSVDETLMKNKWKRMLAYPTVLVTDGLKGRSAYAEAFPADALIRTNGKLYIFAAYSGLAERSRFLKDEDPDKKLPSEIARDKIFGKNYR